jgi:hypothetical protein
MRDDSGSVRNLVIGMLLVAAPFAAAYFLTRSNENSLFLLIIAVFFVGLALAFAMASGLQQVGTIAFRLSGRSSRDIVVVGLGALSLLTPWSIELAMGHLHQIFGWTNPVAWVLAIGLLLSVTESARPYHGWALAASGLALLAWVGWASWLLTTPGFTSLHFSFMPVDLFSTGWFAGLGGFLLASDGYASRQSRDPVPGRPRDVWLLALVPGMGLVRLGFYARGRAWLGAAVLAVAFTAVSAVSDSEFSYWAHYNTMPPNRGRLDVVIGVIALGLVMLFSWIDTWRSLRQRVVMGDWLARVRARSREGR